MFIESKNILKHDKRVLTPYGYQTIEYVHKTPKLPGLSISFGNGNIKCSRLHTFVIKGREVSACDLEVGDVLETVDDFVTITSIEELPEQHFYDISLLQSPELENETYYSNGVLSHNSGKSITVATYLCWIFLFNQNTISGIVANRAAQAKEFLNNVKEIFSRLPMWMTPGITEWNKTGIANELGARILTDVPTSDSFRGFSVNCLSGRHEVVLMDKETEKVQKIALQDLFRELSFFSLDFNLNTKYKIWTSDNGFQDFKGIKVNLNNGSKITFDSGDVLEATLNHQIWNGSAFVTVEQLNIGDSVDGRIVTDIQKIDTDLFYDPVEVEGGHTYWSRGFIHHNCVIVDECAFIDTKNWEEFADSIFPSQSALAFKKNIIISTAKGMNHFFDIVQRAKAANIQNLENPDAKGKTVLEEVKWDEVPRYDKDGHLIDPEDFKSDIIRKRGRVHFEQNYGNSFVGSSDTLLDQETLSSLSVVKPIDIWDGKLNVYEEPLEGHIYVMGVDTAKDGIDAFAVQILDVTNFPFKQVASANIQVNYIFMPDFLFEWGAKYNTARVIIENNEGAGQSTADTLYFNLEYPNMHFDKNQKGSFKDYPGFRTTSVTRDKILNLLKVLGNSGRIDIVDQVTIHELMRFESINGKFQAATGFHDDAVMSLALCLAPFANFEDYNDLQAFKEALGTTEQVNVGNFFDTSLIGFSDG